MLFWTLSVAYGIFNIRDVSGVWAYFNLQVIGCDTQGLRNTIAHSPEVSLFLQVDELKFMIIICTNGVMVIPFLIGVNLLENVFPNISFQIN